MNKDLTFDGKTEKDFNFKEPFDYTCQWFWVDLKCVMTVNIYESDMRPFINTYSNIDEMITNIKKANPHLFFSFEPISRKVDYWWKQEHLNGRSWRRVSMEILNDLERWCIMNYNIPFNPYYELTEEQVLEIENKLRIEDGEEPIKKFFRNE